VTTATEPRADRGRAGAAPTSDDSPSHVRSPTPSQAEPASTGQHRPAPASTGQHRSGAAQAGWLRRTEDLATRLSQEPSYEQSLRESSAAQFWRTVLWRTLSPPPYWYLLSHRTSQRGPWRPSWRRRRP